MKRIATLAVILLLGFAAQAHSVRYFTYTQAQRAVRYLDAQNEMMIYCGYDYEIETYVLVNEVWMERVNSAYYEIWVYGWDAYTGDEIYMPLDLGCVWLFSAGRIYNAAQYLRFHTSVRPPQFSWSIPSYNHYTRVMHRPGFTMTYHYDIHRHGWMPPAHGHHHGHQPPLPPYYMRTPGTPAPRPQATWTPGVDRPVVVTGSSTVHTETGRTTTGGAHTQPSGRGTTASGVRTGGTSTGTPAAPATNNRSTGTTPTRGNVPAAQPKTDSTSAQGTTTNTRGTTGTTTNTRGTSSSKTGTGTTTNTRGTSSSTTGTGTTTNTRGTSSTTTSTRGTSGTTTGSRSTASTSTGTRTTGSSSTGTRGSATTTAKPKTDKPQADATTDKPKTNTRPAAQGSTGNRTGSR